MAEIAGFFDRSFSELATVLAGQGIAPTGPAFARYAGPPGETADLEVGFPVDDAVAPEGQVHPSSLPAGRVARLVHAGGYDQLGRVVGSPRRLDRRAGSHAGRRPVGGLRDRAEPRHGSRRPPHRAVLDGPVARGPRSVGLDSVGRAVGPLTLEIVGRVRHDVLKS